MNQCHKKVAKRIIAIKHSSSKLPLKPRINTEVHCVATLEFRKNSKN